MRSVRRNLPGNNLRILVAADSFKDALPSTEVCAAIARGLRVQRPDATIIEHPLADGGEGTLAILARHLDLQLIEIDVHDPLQRPHRACFGITSDGAVAYVELAQASGLQLLTADERDAMRTTTRGTGELLAAATARGVRRIVLAIGGSATNDAGVGLLQALGWNFLTADGRPVEPIGGQLIYIARIVPPKLNLSKIDVLCDVDNPLYGSNGAAYVYAKQKGANDRDIAALDAGLRHFADCIVRIPGRHAKVETPGAGAAGGVGYAALNFLNATLHRGIEYILDATKFDAELNDIDLVVTGEGHIDAQTTRGKLVRGVCRRAAQRKVPVVALCGQLSADTAELKAIGLRQAYDINSGYPATRDMLAQTANRLADRAARISLDD